MEQDEPTYLSELTKEMTDGLWLGLKGQTEYELIKLILNIPCHSKPLTTSMVINYIDHTDPIDLTDLSGLTDLTGPSSQMDIRGEIYRRGSEIGCPRSDEPKYRSWIIRILRYFGFDVVSGRTVAMTVCNSDNPEGSVTFFKACAKIYTGDHRWALDQYLLATKKRANFIREKVPFLDEDQISNLWAYIKQEIPECRTIRVKDVNIPNVNLSPSSRYEPYS
jgi:hypothetical protein